MQILLNGSVWPTPPWTFFGGPVMRLHVIFGFEDTPEGKKINYQVWNRHRRHPDIHAIAPTFASDSNSDFETAGWCL